jgi:hypothetical protein
MNKYLYLPVKREAQRLVIMMQKTFFPLLLLLFPVISLLAQEKVEVERRIAREEVPAMALSWFDDAYEEARKVRWYLEKGSDGLSYEAKLKWKGHLHSVEFDSTGTIEDIETRISQREMPAVVRENIRSYFASEYERYRIRKIQRQWIGEVEDLEDAIDEGEIEEVTTRYEIEFYGKTASSKELWEALFDHHGSLVRRRIIRLRPTDNLNF